MGVVAPCRAGGSAAVRDSAARGAARARPWQCWAEQTRRAPAEWQAAIQHTEHAIHVSTICACAG